MTTIRANVSKCKPMGKYILVRRDKADEVTKGGIILPADVQEEERPFMGEVIAIGDGELLNETRTDYQRVPIKVKAGQRVLYRKYRGIEFEESEEKYIFLEQDEILAIL